MFFGCLPCCGDQCCDLSAGIGHKFADIFTVGPAPANGDVYSPGSGITLTGAYSAQEWKFDQLNTYTGNTYLVPTWSKGQGTVPPPPYQSSVASVERVPHVYAIWFGEEELAGLNWNNPLNYECNRLKFLVLYGGRRYKSVYAAFSSSWYVVYGLSFEFDGKGLYPKAGIDLANSRLSSTITITSVTFFDNTFPSGYVFLLPEHPTVLPGITKRGYSSAILPLNQWGGALSMTAKIRAKVYLPKVISDGLHDGWEITEDAEPQYAWAELQESLTWSWPDGYSVYDPDRCP